MTMRREKLRKKRGGGGAGVTDTPHLFGFLGVARFGDGTVDDAFELAQVEENVWHLADVSHGLGFFGANVFQDCHLLWHKSRVEERVVVVGVFFFGRRIVELGLVQQ